MRAFAIVMVLLVHTRVLAGGYIGVDVFFVLSGYLITTILLREIDRTGTISLLRFYARRALRLLPALVVLLIVFSLYDLLVLTKSVHSSTITSLPAVLLYVGNWVQVANGVDALGLWGHTWSLSVEEQFYLVWPVLLLVLARWNRKAVGVAAVLVILAVPVLRGVLINHDASAGRMRGTDVFADTLVWGCLLAVVIRSWPEIVRLLGQWLWLPATVYLLWRSTAADVSSLGGLDLTVIAACSAAILAKLITCPEGKVSAALNFRPLVFTGKISYGLYLWHLPITIALTGHVTNRWALTVAVVIVTVPAALASWFFVEQPALRLKNRFETPRTHPGVLDATSSSSL